LKATACSSVFSFQPCLSQSTEVHQTILYTQFSNEIVTHVQPELGRLAWKYTPDLLLQSERWQALSDDLGNGKVLYESREVFSGELASVLQVTMGRNLQSSFEAQANGLKLLLEGAL
jgi:hypothetical protein